MEIPFLSSFIEGLKLFFASKKLKWLTLVFIIGAFVITIWENLMGVISVVAPALFPTFAFIGIFVGGVFPVFFMITAFLSILGLQRFVASEESYAKSFALWLIWMVVSLVMLIVMWTVFFVLSIFIFFGVAFLGWIGFQSYFSTRNAVNYAQGVDIDHRSKLSTFLFWGANVFNYVIIIGAFIGTIIFVNPAAITFPIPAATGWAIVGMLLALGFNFLNGLIVTWERNKSYAENIVLLGTFIALYSAYFIYNVLKGFTAGFDFVSIGISVFFILYTMSSVGKSLASRAEKETRFKISKELAATFTFFLASGFMFVDAMFTTLLTHPLLGPTDPSLAGSAGDAVKLIVFPFVALLMEIRFIWKAKRVTTKPTTPDDIPVIPVEEESVEEVEEPVIVDTPEPVDTPLTYEKPVEEEPSDFSEEEPVEEEESSDYE